jgi:uncharacterized protein (DUF3820 family)
MNNIDFDPQAFLAEMELEEEGQRLRLDEMRRRGEITLIPFGIYKGKRIDLIPDHYLLWAIRECDFLTPHLRRAILKHLRSVGYSD